MTNSFVKLLTTIFKDRRRSPFLMRGLIEADFNREDREPCNNGNDASNRQKYSLEDFELVRVVGRGAYGKVLLGKLKATKKLYAIKAIKKASIAESDDITWLQTEKYVYEIGSSHPFLVGLHSCFQTPSRLFYVMEFVRGGDLMFYMNKRRRLLESHARFYAAEISLALNFLHKNGIIYRDLKLENVLLDDKGHVRLTDFGICKEGMHEGEKTSTFCGTPTYMAPELVQGDPYSFSVDWWALGILLFEMLTGRGPFDCPEVIKNPDEDMDSHLFQQILKETIHIPRCLSRTASSVLKGFLCKEPNERLGCVGQNNSSAFAEVMSHPFFKPIDWKKLERKEISPPYVPHLNSNGDLAHFPSKYTGEPVQFTPDDPEAIDRIDQTKFKGFESVNSELMLLENCV